MEVLGHSQFSLTLNTYAHVIPALQADPVPRRRRGPGPVKSAGWDPCGYRNGYTPMTDATGRDVSRRNFQGLVVSRVGIEPTTRRLRVCCSAN